MNLKGPQAMKKSRVFFVLFITDRSFGYGWDSLYRNQETTCFKSQLWLVLQYTHSSAAVGLVLAVTLLPAVFFAPIAGVYVDKEDRRTILVISNLLQSLVVLALGVMYTFMALDYSVILAS